MAAPSRLEELAIVSGRPAFAEPLHVGRPNIGDRKGLIKRIEAILDSRWLTNDGPTVREFESRVAGISGVRHCIATCNGTAALDIAIQALGLKGEVIVPSFTFVATAHALVWRGITPVFCDVDPATHNLDPERAAALVNARTTGILGVHLWGRPCAIEPLQSLARSRGLKLLFDAAHAFGGACDGRPIGGFGDAEVFSFHATKFVNSGEGGAVVTNDADLAKRLRLLRNFGFAGFDNVVSLGVNAKMSEIAAAMGLSSLEAMDEIVAVNRRNWSRYREALDGIAGVGLVAYKEADRSSHQYVVLEIDEPRAGIGRDALIEVLQAENVLARRYFYPGCHRMEPYRTQQPDVRTRLPHTEALAGRVLVLPTGTAIGSQEIETIAAVLRLAVTRAPEVRARLQARASKV